MSISLPVITVMVMHLYVFTDRYIYEFVLYLICKYIEKCINMFILLNMLGYVCLC